MALVGVILPLLPTVDFVLLAAFLFSRSSERFDRWLATNRLFGGIVREWRTGRGFTVRSKVIAAVGITVSFAVSLLLVSDSPILRLSLVLMGIGIIWYVLSRPTIRPSEARNR